MRIDDANVLLRLIPKHTRTSCSDDKAVNYYTTEGRGGHPRCMRCLLLAIISGKVTDDIEVDLSINVRYKIMDGQKNGT